MRKVFAVSLILCILFCGVMAVYASSLDVPPDDVSSAPSEVSASPSSSSSVSSDDDSVSSGLDGSSSSSDSSVAASLPPIENLVVEADKVTIQYQAEPEAYALVNTPLNGGYYIDAVTSQLGNVRIYVPSDFKADSFSYSGSNVISLRSSTISGVLYTSGSSYSVRWSAFSSPQYRVSSNGSYANLTITEVVDTNIGIFSSDPGQALSLDILYLVIILVIGVIGICLFMRL